MLSLLCIPRVVLGNLISSYLIWHEGGTNMNCLLGIHKWHLDLLVMSSEILVDDEVLHKMEELV